MEYEGRVSRRKSKEDYVGFTLKEFNEYPNWEDEKIPGEFTILAIKQDEL
ncbi:hypothetical protein [Clostridium algidicarnis]|nr:hypothetical protein [Clostridium algidicarnis]MBU3204884.1 hypothetical protein [Clostridium algidicarnis]MBU3213038.1 hypothetical protein [Clostridium algidicarnis]